MNGFINCTQKSSNIVKTKEEKGITLIALLVTVILLVILVGVAVSQITGDEGIIVGTETAVDDYKYQQYKEQIEQLVHSIIIADSLAGRTTTVTSMAEEMEKETWIKEAVPNEESKDIIVTVDAGYVYQIYYDELTGMISIDSVGTEDGAKLPTIKAIYNKEKYTIEVEASCEDGIEKIELIYGGEVIETVNSETASFEVEKSGWYQVKATSGKGKTRYANVRVSNEVGAPSIKVTSNGEEENGWYGRDNVAVEITISSEETNVKGIYYKKNTDEEYTYVEGRSTIVTINTVGRTVIYGYAVDEKGNESEIVRIEIKYDNVAPEVGAVAVSPEVPASGWYNTDVEITLPNMTDANSGLAGYYYWQVTDTAEIPDEEKNYVSGTDKKLTVKSEGEITLSFQAIDKAGNKSGISSITIKKDSLSPKDFTISVSNQNKTGFTINAGTTDDTSMTNSVSGMSHYEIYMNGSLKETIEVTDETNPTVSYVAENLNENAAYTISVKAYDKAGNVKESASMIGQTGEVTEGGSNPGEGDNPGGDLDAGIDFGDLTEEEKKELVGKYIDYVPVVGSFTSQGKYNGGSDQIFTTQGDLKWQILFVNNSTITLVSENSTNTNFLLSEDNGYNNGVKILNDAGYAMYSNSSLGAAGRSVNIDDIEVISKYNKNDAQNYGQEYSPSSKNYPNIFAQEKNGSIDGIFGSTLEQSEQIDWVTGNTEATKMTGIQTYYTYEMSTSYIDSIYLEILKDSKSYWLASRCVNCNPQNQAFSFRMFYVSDANLDAHNLYDTLGNGTNNNYALRPIVEIDLSKVNIGETGDGSRENPYSIAQKSSDSGQEPGEDDAGIDFGGLTEEEKNSMIGEYVNYIPLSTTFISEGKYNGGSNKSFSTVTTLKWRILFIDDSKITLISDKTANTGFTLGGYNGYNNGVLLLNDACKAMYSNNSLNSVVRNLNIDDIESISSYNKNSYQNYGREYDFYQYGDYAKYYPNIFADELTCSVNNVYGKTLGLSDQTEYITGYSTANALKAKQTFYKYTMSTSYMSETYYNMITSQTTYWLASRCFNFNGSVTGGGYDLRMFCVYGNTINGNDEDYWYLYRASNGSYSYSFALRPVIEIDLSAVTIGKTGSGTATSPYSIEAK